MESVHNTNETILTSSEVTKVDSGAILLSSTLSDVAALSAKLATTEESDDYDFLKAEGITIKTIVAEDGTVLIFPLGGEPWEPYLPVSEAWGYALRNAALRGDKDFFQGLANSYLYCCNLTVRCYENTGEKYEWAPFANKFGLMGWQLNVWENPPVYDAEWSCGAATDGDLDIVKALMIGLEKFGNIEIKDPINTPPRTPNFNPEWVESIVEVPYYRSIDLQSLATHAAISIMQCECGEFSVDQVTKDWSWYSHVPEGTPLPQGVAFLLQPNDWPYQTPVYMDYFDPQAFVMMIDLLESQGIDATRLKNTLRDTMQMINAFSLATGGWVADVFNTDPSRVGPESFTAEGLRFLMRFGEFVGNRENSNNPLYSMAAEILQRMVKNCINTMTEHSMGPNWTTWMMGGLAKSSFTGPLLLAMSALRVSGYAPPNLTDEIYAKSIEFYKEDMLAENDFAGFESWTVKEYNSNGHYFDLELGVLSEQIMRNLDIMPV